MLTGPKPNPNRNPFIKAEVLEVVANYVNNGRYQCLAPRSSLDVESTLSDDVISEVTAWNYLLQHVEVYRAAARLGIPHLRDLKNRVRSVSEGYGVCDG